jgi:DNA-binding CsgD family transcriptional regulator
VNQIYATATLSRRETEVFRLLGDGKTTSEIAVDLKISLKTVQTYCDRLKQKMRSANIDRLVRVAVLWRAGVTEIFVEGTRERAGRKQVAGVSACKSRNPRAPIGRSPRERRVGLSQ